MENASAAWPETRWTLIGRVADLSAPAAREHLGVLIARYREPLRAFMERCLHGRHGLDPEDLVQEFLTLRWLEGPLLSRVRRDGPGRFRSFLKKVARDFVIDQLRSARRRREVAPVAEAGGDVGPAGDAERSESFVEAAAALDFEIALGDLREALRALEAECRADGRAALFACLLRRFERKPGRASTDKELAGGLGLPLSTYYLRLQELARRLDQLHSSLVREACATPEELASELAHRQELLAARGSALDLRTAEGAR
ncbi:MAG: sigma-70 family RNA polymerase sigma factor [Planctomycetes bacterium]|nr:sigma-70 family RNA polymerase sigma factor [Planctomycetota bacterium]